MRFVSCSFHIIYKWLHRNWNTIFIKYSDDTAIVDLSNSIPHYIEEVDRFTTWCKANFLDLNMAKTKELLIDFRKQPPAVSPITIDGEIVERFEKYKYLGIILDNKLKFDSNVLNINKKCHYRIYCLQRLRNIGINSKIIALYYQSCVETLVSYAGMEVLIYIVRNYLTI